MSGSGYRSVVSASTETGGSLRIRRRGDDGPILVDSPGHLVLGLVFAVPATLVATAGLGVLILPPWNESLALVAILLVMVVVFGAVAAFTLRVVRLGRSRLEIDPRDGRVRAIGRRWSVPADRPAHARAVRLEKGPIVHNANGRSRRTWIIRLACGASPGPRGPGPDAAGGPADATDAAAPAPERPGADAADADDAADAADGDLAFLRTLELLRAWKLQTVRKRARRLAEALDVPLIDDGPRHWDPASRYD